MVIAVGQLIALHFPGRGTLRRSLTLNAGERWRATDGEPADRAGAFVSKQPSSSQRVHVLALAAEPPVRAICDRRVTGVLGDLDRFA